ncbi:hypothetical protein BKA57DRAFT_447772 [Linnemannia elongata]|nr:hypothetical protein BKA57DRAFT_447772 [Linnemannia elongata]
MRILQKGIATAFVAFSSVFLASDDIKAADCCVAVVCSVAKAKLDVSVYQLGFLCFLSIGKKISIPIPLKKGPVWLLSFLFFSVKSLYSFLHCIFRGVRISYLRTNTCIHT